MGSLRVAPPAPTRIFFAAALALCTCGLLAGLFVLDPLAPAEPAGAGGGPISEPPLRGVRLDAGVAAALDWLVRHQEGDGSWRARGFGGRCEGLRCTGPGEEGHDAAVTALAALAFLESGMADRPDRGYGGALGRALSSLALSRDPGTGRFGGSMYSHAIATLAFARAAHLLGGPSHAAAAREGCAYLRRARNPGGVWGYGERDGRNDTSVTGWAAEALFAARAAGLEPPDREVDAAIVAWLDGVTAPDGRVGYDGRGRAAPVEAGVNDHFDPNENLAAVGLGLRLLAGPVGGPALATAVERLSCDLPVWNGAGTSVDFHYWHHGTQALARCRVSQAAMWARWSDRAVRALVPHQRTAGAGCAGGSWDPVYRWGRGGGRVYATAINAVTLARLWRHRPGIAPPGGED